MAGRERHEEEAAAAAAAHQEEEEESEEEEEAYREEGEEDDSCYSNYDEDDTDVGDESGHDSDDHSSSSSEVVGHPKLFTAAMESHYLVDDPESVKHNAREGGISSTPPIAPYGFTLHAHLPAAQARPHFLSASLPGSRTSSPRAGAGTDLMTALQNLGRSGRRPRSNLNPLSRRRSPAPSQLPGQHELHLRRSKSCGEGRASLPPDDLDVWPKVTAFHHPPVADHAVEEEGRPPTKPAEPNGSEGFRCGCLFLPGFSKGKQVQAHKEGTDGVVARVVSVSSRRDDRTSAVAASVASLEKFECGSWSSSVILNGEDDDEAKLSYFDLPLELIRSGANDTDSPVKTAFVFDSDRKGVLKKSCSRVTPRKSHDSPNRHVTFSAPASSHPTSPTTFCISPRLRKAREEFNAFLDAQSA